MDSQYRTQEWLQLRSYIIKRDNYSCQNCGTFNPAEGWVSVKNDQLNDLELHNYDSNTCQYHISSHRTGITLSIDYGWGIWLVTPILQVHHKKYIQERMPWEYAEEDLITLCNECHNIYHSESLIPIYDKLLNLIEQRHFVPEDNNTGRKHNFKPWVFVNNFGGNYDLTSVHPSLSFLVLAEDLHRINQMEQEANKMYDSFMERFFPDYLKGSE